MGVPSTFQAGVNIVGFPRRVLLFGIWQMTLYGPDSRTGRIGLLGMHTSQEGAFRGQWNRSHWLCQNGRRGHS